MYLNEFKCWLKGYLEGVGVESKEDLEKEDLLVILSKFEELEPTYKTTGGYITWPNKWTENVVFGTPAASTSKRISSMIDELLK